MVRKSQAALALMATVAVFGGVMLVQYSRFLGSKSSTISGDFNNAEEGQSMEGLEMVSRESFIPVRQFEKELKKSDIPVRHTEKESKKPKKSFTPHFNVSEADVKAFEAKEKVVEEWWKDAPPIRDDPCYKDPFGDACEAVGFPTKALGPQDINLCDPLFHAHLPHGGQEFNCPSDKSCRKCRPEYDKVEKYTQAFASKELSKRREAEFAKRFEHLDDEGKVVKGEIVVMAVNFGQLYLFLNWVCSCEKIGLDPREFTYIIPTDEMTYDYLTKLGFMAEPLDWQEVAGLKGGISSVYIGRANTGPHAMINTMIVAGLNAAIQKGHPVFLSDVDIVWLEDPFAFLRPLKGIRDVIGSFAPRDDAFGHVNGGAVFFFPTKRSKVFIQTFLNMCKVKNTSDQVLLNSLLRYFKFRQLNVGIIPHKLFFTIWRSRPKVKLSPMIAHTVGGDKADRMMRYRYWFYNPRCSIFDRFILQDINKRKLINTTEFPEFAT